MLTKLLARIESSEFSAEANLASDYSLFTDFLEQDVTIAELRTLLIEQPDVVNCLVHRIKLLGETDIAPRYANPKDATIAALAWAVVAEYPGSSSIVLELLSGVTNPWWSSHLAGTLESQHPSISSQDTLVETAAVDWAGGVPIVAVSSNGDRTRPSFGGLRYSILGYLNDFIVTSTPPDVDLMGTPIGGENVLFKIFESDDLFVNVNPDSEGTAMEQESGEFEYEEMQAA